MNYLSIHLFFRQILIYLEALERDRTSETLKYFIAQRRTRASRLATSFNLHGYNCYNFKTNHSIDLKYCQMCNVSTDHE